MAARDAVGRKNSYGAGLQTRPYRMITEHEQGIQRYAPTIQKTVLENKTILARRLIVTGFCLFLLLPTVVTAQPDYNAWTVVALNMRSGPGQTYSLITQLPANTGLVLETRSADATWLLGHTPDGRFRGWVASAYVAYHDGFDPVDLPVDESILVGSPGGTSPDGESLNREVAYEAVDMANGEDLMLARAALIDLDAYPVIPETAAQMRPVFERGQKMGRDPAMIAKVGDCNSAGWVFLWPFGEGRYDLGEYTDLQPVIDQFEVALATRTYASHNGLNANAVLDPMWADPYACEPGESSLACEYRLHNPGVAVIMFGTNDLLSLTAPQFDQSLRRVVIETQQAGIIPLLSTFPLHLSLPDRAKEFNQIVVRIALDYNLPLINLWRALEPLPNHGIAPDGFHLSGPLTEAGDLHTAANLDSGFPRRNLVTLQALDVVWRTAMQP